MKKILTSDEANLITQEVAQEITEKILEKFPQITEFSSSEKLALQFSALTTIKVLEKLKLIEIES